VSGGAVGRHRLVVVADFVGVRFGLFDMVLVAVLGVEAVDVGAVARPLDAPLDHVLGGVFQIPRPPDASEELDELRRQTVVHGQLGRPVVPGEGVVVVVPSLAKRPQAHPFVLLRHYAPGTKIRNLSKKKFKCLYFE
jgi:hypothetical protein